MKHKVVVLGDSSVGKTAFINRLILDDFTSESTPTIAATFKCKKCDYQNQRYDIQIWDTAGEEKFRSLAPIYVQNASLAYLVFDLTSLESFDNIEQWYKLSQSNGTIPTIILGNKNDLENKFDSFENIYKKCMDNYHSQYIDISAKTGSSIDIAFKEGLNLIHARNKPDRETGITISPNTNIVNKKKGCC